MAAAGGGAGVEAAITTRAIIGFDRSTGAAERETER